MIGALGYLDRFSDVRHVDEEAAVERPLTEAGSLHRRIQPRSRKLVHCLARSDPLLSTQAVHGSGSVTAISRSVLPSR